MGFLPTSFPQCTMASDVGDEGRLIDGVVNQ